MATTSFLSPTQRYGAGALFALALHQAQMHQTRPLGMLDPDGEDDGPGEERPSSGSSSDSVSEDPDLWVHENSGLLLPVFRFLDIDKVAWLGLEETAGSSPAKHHVGAFLRLLAEDTSVNSSESSDQQLALSKAIDSLTLSMETNPASSKSKKEKHQEYENECREKLSTNEAKVNSEATVTMPETSSTSNIESPSPDLTCAFEEEPVEEVKMLSYERKLAVLYELLTACLADIRDNDKKSARRRKGYDARHRVALRLLATWLDINWVKM
ncbi:hypothetical protein CRG98_009583, partial [Punica granatum]